MEDIKILEDMIEDHKDYFCGSYELVDDLTITLRDIEAIQNLIARYKELERQVKIKNAYLTLINDIAYDYDGCNTVKSLKELIDELVKMTKQAYKNDDWTVMYTDLSQTINKNILQELLED